MVNVIPPDHVDDLPVVEPNQHDEVPVVPEPVLKDENEDPEEEEYMEVDIEEDDNEPKLTYPYEEDSDGLLPGLMRRDIYSLFGRMASLSRQLCGRETAHALVEKKGKVKDEYYGKLILDLGNKVREERPNKAIDVLVEDEKSPSSEIMPLKSTPLTQAAVRRMIKESDDATISVEQARHANAGNDARGSGRVKGQDAALAIRKCTFARFMKCNPTIFHSIKGDVELRRWFKKTESVFGISECAEGKKVKFSTATLQGHYLTRWNSKNATMGLETVNQMHWTEMKQLMTAEFCPGEVTSSRPANLNEAMRMAHKLMKQKSQAMDERILEGKKRKWENFQSGNNSGTTRGIARKRVLPWVLTLSLFGLAMTVRSKGLNVVTGMFLLNNRYASVLFDSSSDRSFVDTIFSSMLDIDPVKINASYKVEFTDGRVVSTNTVLKGCTLNLVNHLFEIDLMPIELGTFDVIIGIDWLVKHDAVIVCGEKVVRIPYGNKTLIVESDKGMSRLKVISCIKDHKYIERGCHLFLAHVTEKKPKEKRLEDVPIIHEFSEVFPDDFLGLPSPRQIEFQIDLVPRAAPVTRALYRLALSEMRELSIPHKLKVNRSILLVVLDLNPRAIWRALLKKTTLIHSIFFSMDSQSAPVVSAAKLPILNPNEFDLWKIRIEQYFLMTDYSLWEVIINGDSVISRVVVDGVAQPVTVLTAEQKLARKNELKACGSLLMALPDKHQLKFNSHKDAKTLMEAIEKHFRGNTETKKVQKTLLKQKLQKLVSQLEIHEVSLSQEDVNLKFLRSLPSEWKTHTLIWRNKANLEEHSLDDMFNSFKIHETEVRHSFSPSNPTQNLAFVSSSNTDSTTDSVSAATSVSAICAKLHVSSHSNIDSLNNEDLKQIDVDDLKEMDLRWQMAMLTMRARRFLQKTGRNMGDNRVTTIGFDMSKVECYNCHKKGHFARECRSPKDTKRKGEEEPANFSLMAISSSSSSYDNEVQSRSTACSKAYKQLHSQYDSQTIEFRKSRLDVLSYQAALESVESRLVMYKQNESIFQENIIVLKNEVEARDNFILTLKQKLKQTKIERDDLKLKFEKFQSSSKSLTELIASQTNNKHGLGYLSSEDDSESVSLTCPSDRLSPSGGYHDFPPPITRNFMPPKPDLVFHTAPLAVESNHSAFNVQHIEVPILAATPKPTIKTSSSGKRKNRKTYFVCRSMDYLIKDCDFHVKPQTKPTPRNSTHMGCNKQYASFTMKYPQKHKVPAAVLPKSKPVSVTAVRQVSATVPKIMKSRPRPAHPLNKKSNPSIRRYKTHNQFSKTSNSSSKVTTTKVSVVSAIKGKKGKWVWRPKCPILDHDSRTTSASMILKRFDYNDAAGRSKSVMAWVPKRI
nr:putative reverse transcriptase domain-containing protein [Tanacetum cinerariifolium]